MILTILRAENLPFLFRCCIIVGWSSDGVLKLFDFGLSVSVRAQRDRSEQYRYIKCIDVFFFTCSLYEGVKDWTIGLSFVLDEVKNL